MGGAQAYASFAARRISLHRLLFTFLLSCPLRAEQRNLLPVAKVEKALRRRGSCCAKIQANVIKSSLFHWTSQNLSCKACCWQPAKPSGPGINEDNFLTSKCNSQISERPRRDLEKSLKCYQCVLFCVNAYFGYFHFVKLIQISSY